MKKLLLLCFLSMLMFGAYSQKTIFGFETFTGFSNVYFDDNATKLKQNLGFTFTVAFKLNTNFYLQTGIGFDRNGHMNKESFSDKDYSYTVFENGDIHNHFVYEYQSKENHSKNYICLPLQFRFSNIGRQKKLRIRAGMYYAYLISMDYKGKRHSIVSFEPDNIDHKRTDWDRKEKLEIRSHTRRSDWGLNFDISREMISWGHLNFNIGLYGKLGLLSQWKYIKFPKTSGQNYSFGIKLLVENSFE
jgi:hypothetical protein